MLDQIQIVPLGQAQFSSANYLSVDPAQRGWASDVATAAAVALGTPMRARRFGQKLILLG